jgi:PBSX family phage portal protein
MSMKAESQQLTDHGRQAPGVEGLKEPPLNPRHLTELLKMNTTHYRCCKTKAREGGGMGYEIVAVDQDTNNVEPSNKPTPPQKGALIKFFEALEDPITELLVKVLMDYQTLGYAAIEYIADDESDEPDEIKHIPAQYLKRHTDMKRYVMERNAERVWFKDIRVTDEIDVNTGEPVGTMNTPLVSNVRAPEPDRIGDSGAPLSNRANALIWFVNYSPDSDYYGMPDVLPATGAIVGDIARRDYNIAFFDNYGIPAYGVFVSGNFDPGEPVNESGEPDPNGRTPLEATLEDHFKQLAQKPHSTMVLTIPSVEGGEGEVEVKIEKLGHDVEDASFRLFRADNRDEILSAHGVPAERAGIHVEGSLGGNIARESTEIYKRSVLKPLQKMLERALNRHVIRGGFGIEKYEFKLSEIDIRDLEAEFSRDIQMVQNAGLSPNEFRDRWGLPRVEDPYMDMHYMAGRPLDAGENEIPPALSAMGLGGNDPMRGANGNGRVDDGRGKLGGRNGKDPDPSVTGPAIDRGVRTLVPRNPSRS